MEDAYAKSVVEWKSLKRNRGRCLITIGCGKTGNAGYRCTTCKKNPFPQTTARSDGFNSVLKKYVNPNNLLVEFAKRYTAIQAKVLVSVAKEQVETICKEMDTYSFNPLELQVRGLYTHNIYSKFQMEMKVKTGYRCDSLQDGTFRCSSV
ncbi:Protein FAR-RED IMPAIRED RESPONSE 1 [Hordeum vulgare]|nr:Protein FAR-RED IMPAIRED RESPONSE 1 [Hordeum vulgare]